MSVKPDISHDASPDAYAAAMVMCQGYAPQCSDAGECFLDGKCFTPSGIGYRAAHRILSDLIDGQSDPHVKAWLVHAMSAMEHYRRLELP